MCRPHVQIEKFLQSILKNFLQESTEPPIALKILFANLNWKISSILYH